MKRKGISVALLATVATVILTACGGNNSSTTDSVTEVDMDNYEYEVILPTDYEESGENYPVIYIMPQNGYDLDDSGIAEQLQQTMGNGICVKAILVKPTFKQGMDVHETMATLVAKVDAEYRTKAEARYRAAIGTGVGGYLSYVVGLTEEGGIGGLNALKEPALIASMASVRGDFVSEENPWCATYGSTYEHIRKIGKDNIQNFYTYMDAPVEDAWSDMEGSTNDMGALFIEYGTKSTAHEFTVRAGNFSEGFLTESVSRVANRLTTYMFTDGATGNEGAPQATTVPEEDAVVTIEGANQTIDLSGSWYFNYVGTNTKKDAATLTPEEYKAWSVVVPGSHWTKGYGNINDENVKSPMGEDYFDYMIVGSGYYVKPFDVPKEFGSQDLILSVGYVDDRCEVFLNGERIGVTGMDEKGNPTGETTWAVYSTFTLESELLKRGETNTLVVRAWNDTPYGAGGWYAGPIGIYSESAFEDLNRASVGGEERFYEETFTSAYAASARGQSGTTVENPYLIYLPEGYEESDRYYPTVYLFHQFNSDHTSYRLDKVNEILDEAIAAGEFDEMIVVVPNSAEESWWRDDWEKMIVEELIPHIDENYRTIKDARYRLTAGCSMGGQGAYGVALRNPDYFTGAISFFGAFSMGEEYSPNQIATQVSDAYLDYYTMYFICGNQDVYGFGVPAIELHQVLAEKNIAHRFFIENGGHDGAFYLPFFDDAFAYTRANMYQSDDAVEKMLAGTVDVTTEDGILVETTVQANADIANYFHAIPDSPYTKNGTPDLYVSLILEVMQDGKTVYNEVERDFVLNADSMESTFTYDISEEVDTTKEYTIVWKAAIFDRVVDLHTVTVK